ncbi:Deoxyuridine 5'-triphosphate nucleotidohydrolase, partial [Grifola frondosa]
SDTTIGRRDSLVAAVARCWHDIVTAELTRFGAPTTRPIFSLPRHANNSHAYPMSEEPQVKKRKMSSASENGNLELAPVSSLLIKRHSEKAKLPTRGSALAAGYDLYRTKSHSSARKALVDTQISLLYQQGPMVASRLAVFFTLYLRSGVTSASKFMIDTGAGVIDADYRGVDFVVEEGDRIAQLILERVYTPEVLEVENLDETLRGAGGFGSTGGHIAL